MLMYYLIEFVLLILLYHGVQRLWLRVSGNPYGPWFRSVRGYKYQTTVEMSFNTPFRPPHILASSHEWIYLFPSGCLTIKKGYCWDGPSGPTIDTVAFLMGSLPHDAFYQMSREGVIEGEEAREMADDTMRTVCLKAGMSRFRAWYCWKGVRLFAGRAARPS